MSKSDQSEVSSQIELEAFKPRMKPNEKDKLNGKRTMFLSLSFFVVLLAWSYFNFKIPKILDDLIADTFVAKQTTKGIIMALDNLVAVVLQPYFGSLSDRTGSKFGRRMPYIITGTILSAFFLILMPWVQFLLGFTIIILLFDLSMSLFRSVSVAILPDYTPDSMRSQGSAIQQFIANMGGVFAFAVPMIVAMIMPSASETNQTVAAFSIVGGVMILSILLQFLTIKETPTSNKLFEIKKKEIEMDPISLKVNEKKTETKKEEPKIIDEIKSVFKQEEKSFANMLMVVFFSYLGFAAVEAFFSSFAEFYMGKADSVSGTLFMAYSVPMILTAYFWGILGQKIGRKKAAKFGLIGILIGVSIMTFVTAPLVYNPVSVPETSLKGTDYLVMINLAIISMPWMCFIVNSFPIIWNLAPESKVGTYTGIYYTFNQLAYSLSPIVLGINLDFFQSFGARQYYVMFPFVLVCMICSYLFLRKVKRGDVDVSQEKAKEYEEKYKQTD